MNIIINNSIDSTIRNLTLEEQASIENIEVNYTDISDKYILAWILGRGIDKLSLHLTDGVEKDVLLALSIQAKDIEVISVDNTKDSVDILGSIFPEKLPALRRAMMLNKNLLEVVRL